MKLDLNTELAKITVVDRILRIRLKRFPHAYEDRDPRINCTGIHNLRAELINRLEKYYNHQIIVKYSEKDHLYLAYNRQDYLRRMEDEEMAYQLH